MRIEKNTSMPVLSHIHLFFLNKHFVYFTLQREVVSKKGPRAYVAFGSRREKNRDRYEALFHNEEKIHTTHSDSIIKTQSQG